MIDNLLRMARLNNIFQPTEVQPTMPPGMMPEIQPEEPFIPEHVASDRVNAMLGNMPERQAPGALNRIGSMMAGIAHGPNAQQAFLNAPYEREMSTFQDKFKPTLDAANLERFSNVNERTLRAQDLRQKNSDKTAELAGRKQTETERNNRESTRIREITAKASDFKARNPNHVMKEDDNGFIVAVNPQDNSTEYLTDPQGNRIKSSELPEATKINMQIKGRLDAIAASGKEARITKAAPKAAGSGTTAKKDELPTQTRIRQFNKAREALNSHPEWAKFIKIGAPGSNDFEIIPPSPGAWFNKGPSDTDYQTINEFVYGKKPETPVIPARSSNSGTPQVPSKLAGDATAAKRERVIKILTEGKKPITDANIVHVMGKLK